MTTDSSSGREPVWETVIGIEVHAQLRTHTKMFCGCSAAFGAPPNRNVCPVCLGLPGALPVANERAISLAVRAALALGCEVHARSEFVRKNYFYPDLPKGYQITQFNHPLATRGEIRLRADGGDRVVRVRRLHLEEDAGKSLHDRYESATAVDLNRAGVPLVEIVTEPDLRTPEEARAYLSRLKQLLEHYAAVSDCNMEEGSLRADANLSVRVAGDSELGTKTEVKNLNSFSNVEKALAYERDRHTRRLESGRPVARETRLFDAARGETRALRGKEEDFDYRYFPEPDLVPVELPAALVETGRTELGELPHELEARLMADYGLGEYDAVYLSARPDRAAFFEATVRDGGAEIAKVTTNLMMGGLAAEMNRRGEGAREADLLSHSGLRRLAELRLDGTLSSDTVSRALELLLSGPEQDVETIVEAHELAQVGDAATLEGWIEETLGGNPEEASRYAAGEEQLFGFFMGAVMRAAGGKADPTKVKELLRQRLEELAGTTPS